MPCCTCPSVLGEDGTGSGRAGSAGARRTAPGAALLLRAPGAQAVAGLSAEPGFEPSHLCLLSHYHFVLHPAVRSLLTCPPTDLSKIVLQKLYYCSGVHILSLKRGLDILQFRKILQLVCSAGSTFCSCKVFAE